MEKETHYTILNKEIITGSYNQLATIVRDSGKLGSPIRLIS